MFYTPHQKERLFMKIGYARVSTVGQDLEGQIETLQAEGCENIYKDKFTGTSAKRPEFQEMLKALRAGDTLVVTKLDRLARNTKEGIEIVQDLFSRDIKVHVLNVGLLENTSMGQFFLTTMLAVAELERNMIVERTSEGRIRAKKQGKHMGRPSRPKKDIERAMKLFNERETNGMSVNDIVELTKVPRATIYVEARKRKAAEMSKQYE